ncbi:hypothetical protein BKA70DRAFT_1386270 [Coprinopsis sp. MPI-PUGE-AT-0042]|nr:hypothetical protein BKA70DRAFT_1386270 [Coprinopsis sp. MPI-PUGE-AT-0042]
MPSKSPASNPPIQPSPSHTGSVIRKAFLAEACLNLFTLPLITNPRWTLGLLLKHPSHINPASILFARLFGGIIVGGLTSALLAGYSNTRNGIESRRVVYLILGVGEAALIPMLALEAMKDGRDAALSVKVAFISIACLVPGLLWRLYVLGVKPELLGRYTEPRSDRRAGGSDGSINSHDN